MLFGLINKIRKFKKLINLFQDVSKYNKSNPKNIVLIESWLEFDWLDPNIELLKSICKITNSRISPFTSSYWLNLALFYLRFNKKFFLPKQNIFDFYQNNSHSIIWEKLKFNYTKDKLFNFKYKDLDIGIDIYQSYLRIDNEATIDKPTKILKNILIKSLKLADLYENLIITKKVVGILVSHADYYHNNVICKLGHKFSIPVYLISSNRIIMISKPFQLTKLYGNYKNIFSNFSYSEKHSCQEFGKHFIRKRLKGGLVKELPYISKSIFTDNNVNFDNIKIYPIKNKTKLNIVVYIHDFFDSPHCYGKLRYPDFYEWLNYICRELIKLNCNCYLKTHIDASELTIKQTNEFVNLNQPKINLLNKDTKINQILRLADLVVTAYGTCSTELPYLGLPVICTDINPFSSFDFIYTLKKDEELSDVILNKKLWEIKDIKTVQREIEQYCYLHHNHFYNNLFKKASHQYKNNLIDYIHTKKIIDDFIKKIVSQNITSGIFDKNMNFLKFNK